MKAAYRTIVALDRRRRITPNCNLTAQRKRDYFRGGSFEHRHLGEVSTAFLPRPARRIERSRLIEIVIVRGDIHHGWPAIYFGPILAIGNLRMTYLNTELITRVAPRNFRLKSTWIGRLKRGREDALACAKGCTLYVLCTNLSIATGGCSGATDTPQDASMPTDESLLADVQVTPPDAEPPPGSGRLRVEFEGKY